MPLFNLLFFILCDIFSWLANVVYGSCLHICSIITLSVPLIRYKVAVLA
nr:MAG TPA: hypothetical protein [Caudoviricetes sp.]